MRLKRLLYLLIPPLLYKFLQKIKKIACQNLNRYRNPNCNNNLSLSIALIGNGGMGDMLIYINYLTYIRDLVCKETKFDFISIHDVVSQPVLDIALFNGADTVHDSRWYKENGNELNHDIVLILCRLPFFERYNREKIAMFAPKLLPHFDQVFSIGQQYGKDWVLGSDAKVINWTRITGRKRINQFDIGGHLGMSETYRIKVPIIINEEETLAKFGLSGRRFITICRNASMSYGPENTRLWDLENCKQLVLLLKAEYKNYLLVQIGTTQNDMKELNGVDISLLDKTTLEELKVLLKYSALHIDTDTGNMHLRSALRGGKSVIVFGPTSMEVLGYPENINISANVCEPPCEWVTPDWYVKCARGDHACMKNITAEMVIDRIRKEADI